MTNKEFIARLLDIATNYKTVYMWGVFGSPVTESRIVEKAGQYPSRYTTIKRQQLRKLIGRGYFGFDCVGLIKGVLWGWNGNTNPVGHGGAAYNSNGVPDNLNANTMLQACKDISADFKKIVPGEAVWLQGHIGIYIGDGKVIEATPSWKDGVQITACHNIGKISGFNGRVWAKHGKIPFIDYVVEPQGVPTTVTVDGKEYPAIIREGTTVLTLGTLVNMLGASSEVPLRTLAEAMKYSVNYNSTTKRVKLVKKSS